MHRREGARSTPGTVIKAGWIWVGRPAFAFRPIKPEERENFAQAARIYVGYGAAYRGAALTATGATAGGYRSAGRNRMSPYQASTDAARVVGVGEHADAGEQPRLLVERVAKVVVQVARQRLPLAHAGGTARDHQHPDPPRVRIVEHGADRNRVGPDVLQQRVRQLAAGELLREVEDGPVDERQPRPVAVEREHQPDRRVFLGRPRGCPRLR